MNFLIRAEKYAQARGDENRFKHYYTKCREVYSVDWSVWFALTWLYDEKVAKRLKYQ
jgi:hypothetical protein